MRIENFVYILRPEYLSIKEICHKTNYSRSMLYKIHEGDINLPNNIKEYLINNITKHIIELENLLNKLKGETNENKRV